MTYKTSRYNIYKKVDDGLLIYNTYSGAFVHISNEILNKIKKVLNNPNISGDLDIKKIFMENKFLVDKNINELERIKEDYYKEKFNEKRLTLMLLVSESCNFSCPYCYINKKNINMSREIYNLILKFISNTDRKNNLKEIRINFFGGEPLLNHNLNILFLKELNKKIADKTKTFSMATNGYLLTKERFSEYLDNELKNFQVTIDGNRETHNSLRYTPTDKDTFKTIFDNLISIKQLDREFNITIRVNFMDGEDEKYIEFINKFKKEFKDDKRFIIYFRPIMNYKTTKFNNNIGLCLKKDAEDKRLIYTRRFYNGKRKKELLTELNFDFLPVKKNYWCEACLKNYYIIGADGMIYKCNIEIGDKKYSIGKITEGKIIYNFDKIYFEDFSPYDNEECSKCIMLPICQGGCVRSSRDSNIKNCPYTLKGIEEAMEYYHKISIK
jgi:uncharacterized protein